MSAPKRKVQVSVVVNIFCECVSMKEMFPPSLRQDYCRMKRRRQFPPECLRAKGITLHLLLQSPKDWHRGKRTWAELWIRRPVLVTLHDVRHSPCLPQCGLSCSSGCVTGWAFSHEGDDPS